MGSNINHNINNNNNNNMSVDKNNNNNYHHVQKSSSFKPSSPRSPSADVDSKMNDVISMDIDFKLFDPLIIEAFKSEVHEFNTEIELTFGSTINFIERFAIFVNNIDSYKMSDIISIVLSKKQDVFLSETVTNDKVDVGAQSKIKNTNNMIDQKPIYVRSILKLIYYAFLNHIYIDQKYKEFYEQYYETENDQTSNQNLNIPSQNGKVAKNKKNKIKKKSNRQEDVDPFFQCFCQCSEINNLYIMRK